MQQLARSVSVCIDSLHSICVRFGSANRECPRFQVVSLSRFLSPRHERRIAAGICRFFGPIIAWETQFLQVKVCDATPAVNMTIKVASVLAQLVRPDFLTQWT